jgi:acyl-coenzyme A thioesterase 13
MAKLLGDSSKDAEAAAEVREWKAPDASSKLYDVFTVAGLRVDAIEPGRALCTFTVPPRLTVSMSDNFSSQKTACYRYWFRRML